MVTARKSKLLVTNSTIQPNTYYYEFNVDTIAELPTATYQGTNVAHGSIAYIITTGQFYVLAGDGKWYDNADGSSPTAS